MSDSSLPWGSSHDDPFDTPYEGRPTQVASRELFDGKVLVNPQQQR